MADPPQRQGSFWTSVTGVITAVAAFIAAVGTLAGVLAAVGAWPFSSKDSVAAVVEVSASKHSFGDVQVGHASSASVTITNSGKGATLVHTSLEGTNSDDFTIALDTCADAPLATNNSCAVQLTFSPKSPGGKVATLNLRAANAQVPPPIGLDGTGLPLGEVSFDPTSVGISLISLKGNPPTSGTRDLKVINTGGGNLKISSVRIDDTARFSVTAECNNTILEPGESCHITVKFSTTGVGTFRANVVVSDDAAASPHSVPVTGYRGPLRFILPPTPSP